MCPIVQAAILNRLEITKLLLDKGHYIEKPHPKKCTVFIGDNSYGTSKYNEMKEEKTIYSPSRINFSNQANVIFAARMRTSMKSYPRAKWN